MKKRILLAKTGASLPLMRSQALSPQLVAKVRYCQYRNWRRHISHSYLNFGGSFFLAPYAVSSPVFAAMVTVFFYIFTGYNIFTGSVGKRILIVVPCGHHLQDLNHLLLDCRASEPLRKSIFGSSLSILDLWSRPWGVARLLGLRGVHPSPHSPRRGRVVPTHHSHQPMPIYFGMRVIITENRDKAGGFFNGNLGVVHSLSNHTLFVRCNH